MKKKIWLLLVLVLVLACAAGYFIFKKPADVQIDEEHFPDSAFREAVTAFDLDQDGKLSGEEIKKTEYLNIAKKGNQIEEIDFSRNIKMIQVSVSGCKIKDLDLRRYPDLWGFVCEGCGLTELDVSKNKLLDSLHFLPLLH